MGSEAEAEASSTPRLPLLAKPLVHGHMQSPEASGMVTPPHYTAASVPFRWEEEPGKPRNCSTLSKFNPVDFPNRCLELPPRLLLVDANVTKLPSSTTALEDPYTGKARFRSSSFRIIKRERHLGSFRSSWIPQSDQLGSMALSKRGLMERVLLGPWGWGWRKAFKGKGEVGGSSHVFPSSSVDREVDDACNEKEDGSSKNAAMASLRRTGSLSSISPARSQFWVSFRLLISSAFLFLYFFLFVFSG
uniref:Uncharacterized protein MANES_05G021600 n=1 Tax=Rhizophora mucronata TaxID=61149 RepID=A0A2P2IWG3_RHIMU